MLCFALLSTASTAWSQEVATHREPYPPSRVIADMDLDWSTHSRAAPGSDNWQLTWADDGHQYGAWGDGGGFGGSNEAARVGLGFARIEGDWNNYRGTNVWGGSNSARAAQFAGKSYGTVSVRKTFYSWIVPDDPDDGGSRDHYRYIELAKSRDHGMSWEKASWRWRLEDDLIVPTFLVSGKDNARSRDGYMYAYFIRPQSTGIDQSQFGLSIHKPGAVFLARVRQRKIFEGRDAYQWFRGMRGNTPLWGTLEQKKPVFENADGTGWCLSAIYVPGLRRYLLATEHTASHVSLLSLFDAPQPWGPWTTVKYWTAAAPFGNSRPGGPLEWTDRIFFMAFAPKWFSKDGREFTLTFTGRGYNDSFNTVRGRFRLRNQM